MEATLGIGATGLKIVPLGWDGLCSAVWHLQGGGG